LGVDKDGKEWYQITLGGSDGSDLSGAAGAGKVVGPSFSAAEVPEVIEAVINKYLELRLPVNNGANGRNEYFIETLRRAGQDGFKVAANSARHPEASVA
jgi:sulfite reductase (NADPH) hemoprotein beta-component